VRGAFRRYRGGRPFVTLSGATTSLYEHLTAPRRCPCAAQENAGFLKLGALYTLGDITLDTLAADWQRNPRFETRGLETIKVIVKTKEETLRHCDRDSSFFEGMYLFSKKAAR
jgi:hypothetical protein